MKEGSRRCLTAGSLPHARSGRRSRLGRRADRREDRAAARLARRGAGPPPHLIPEADAAMVEDIKWRTPSNPSGVHVWSHGGIIRTGDIYRDKAKLTFAKGSTPYLPRMYVRGFAILMQSSPVPQSMNDTDQTAHLKQITQHFHRAHQPRNPPSRSTKSAISATPTPCLTFANTNGRSPASAAHRDPSPPNSPPHAAPDRSC